MPGIKPRDLDSDLEDYFKTGGWEDGRYRAGTCSAPYLFHLMVSVAVCTAWDAELSPLQGSEHRSGVCVCRREFSWVPAYLRGSGVLRSLLDLSRESKPCFKALDFPDLSNRRQPNDTSYNQLWGFSVCAIHADSSGFIDVFYPEAQGSEFHVKMLTRTEQAQHSFMQSTDLSLEQRVSNVLCPLSLYRLYSHICMVHTGPQRDYWLPQTHKDIWTSGVQDYPADKWHVTKVSQWRSVGNTHSRFSHAQRMKN